MRTHKKTAIRSRTLALETLERRACPAAVSIAAPIAISEAGIVKTITVSLDAPSAAPVSVGYFVQGTATLGADYDLTQGGRRIGSSTGTLTFAPGQTRQTIALSTINDTLREGNETLSITLIRPRGCTLGVNKTSSTVLRDDDNYTAALVGAASISAGGDGRYTLQLSAPATKSETFYVSTVAGSATAGSDFVPLQNMPLAFRAGERSKEFRVRTRANAPGEYDEQFNVQATPSTNGFPAVASFSTTIRGSGVPPILPGISLSDAAFTEGDSGITNMNFIVSLSSVSRTSVSVTYATRDGTATASDNDFTQTGGVLSFAPGETQKTISIAVAGDIRPEPTETFTLVLSAPTNTTISKGVGVATIINDDGEEGFQITVNYLGTVPDSVRTAVTQAVNKWQQVITGDVPSFINPFNSQWVDDIVLDVRMGLLGVGFPTGTDGPNGTIANAAPRFGGAPGVDGVLAIRSAPRLPYWGSIGFDPAEAVQASGESLYKTATHEIGHALGFGSPLFFEPRAGFPNGLVPSVGNPVYTGINAVQAYNEVFQLAVSSIQMETDGGGGTARVHWDDTAMRGEMMTGFAINGPVSLSKITVGAMKDLGYQVNSAAADIYPLPAAVLAVRATSSITTSSAGTRPNLSLAFALYQQLITSETSGVTARGTRTFLRTR